MKHILTLICALMLFGFIFIGCTVDKDFSFELEKEFEVDHSSTTYSDSSDIDVTEESSDFEDYKDDISKISLEEASYTITYFHGTATQTILTSQLQVGEVTGGAPTLLANVDNVNLMSVAAITQTITTNEDGKTKLRNLILNSPYTVRFYYNCTANEAPLDFKVRFNLKFKATYEKKII